MSSTPAGQTGPLILVVDDDRMIRALARDALEANAYRVAEAADGREALEQFEALRPDLVLLDVQMPEMDGYAACRALRERHPRDPTPILIATAGNDRASIDAAYEAGATDFVHKPIHWELLCHRVRYLLRASHHLRELHASRASLARAQELARLGSWEWNPGTGAMRWSEETHRLLGLDPRQCVPDFDLFVHSVHPEDRETLVQQLETTAETGKAFSFEHRLIASGGVEIIVRQQGDGSRSTGPDGTWLSGTLQDVTAEVRTHEQIRYLANYDSLTGLPNRRLFRGQLERAIRAAGEREHALALLYIDLDRFKEVNDTLGHSAGDELLRVLSERFRTRVRGSDIVSRLGHPALPPEVSRLGGDEFTVLLSKIREPMEAGDVAKRLLQALEEPVCLDGQEIAIGMSVGIAVYPDDGADAETIMKNADAAMYHAKELGRNGIQYFSAEINAEALRNLTLESRLREALERDELRLHYQPQVDVATRRITGVEALLRWQHPELGTVRPTEFIPLTEKTGLIVPIGEWALRQACTRAAAWHAAGYPVPVAVNVSTRQFDRVDLVALVRRVLEETGLPASGLELEITESLLLRDTETTARVLADLRAMGVRIALDDFGTGFSSMRYLRSLPLDSIKIDRCFVADLPHDVRAAGITRAMITLAQSLGLQAIAEGVEEEDQAAFLRGAGCDRFQGFLYSRALPPEEFLALLDSSERSAAN